MKFFVYVMITSFILSLFGFFVALREEIAVSLISFEDIAMDIIYNGLYLYFATLLVFTIVGSNCSFALQALVVLIIYEAFAMFAYLLYRRMKIQQERKLTKKNNSCYQLLDEE